MDSNFQTTSAPKSNLKLILFIAIAVILVVGIVAVFVIKSTIEDKIGNYSAGLGGGGDSNVFGGNNGDDNSGDNNGGTGTPSGLDEARGVKCTAGGIDYYFKDGKVRSETNAFGLKVVQILPDSATLHTVNYGPTGECAGVITTDQSTMSASETRERVLGAWEALQGTPGANNQYAAQCEQDDLSDTLFMLPDGCLGAD